MNRLTTKQIAEIIDLRKSGKTQKQISEFLGVPINSIQYWLLTPEEKHKLTIKRRGWYRSLTPQRKSELYKSRKKYVSQYWKNRYQTDEKFRKKHQERMKNYQKMLRRGIKNDRSSIDNE